MYWRITLKSIFSYQFRIVSTAFVCLLKGAIVAYLIRQLNSDVHKKSRIS
jgi:hypothetical protein